MRWPRKLVASRVHPKFRAGPISKRTKFSSLSGDCMQSVFFFQSQAIQAEFEWHRHFPACRLRFQSTPMGNSTTRTVYGTLMGSQPRCTVMRLAALRMVTPVNRWRSKWKPARRFWNHTWCISQSRRRIGGRISFSLEQRCSSSGRKRPSISGARRTIFRDGPWWISSNCGNSPSIGTRTGSLSNRVGRHPMKWYRSSTRSV